MINQCIYRAAALVALMLGFAGCASRGNEVLKAQDTTTVNQTVVDGQTTRDEVQRIYGVPSQTTFLSEKNEVWTYRWVRATAQGQNFIPVVGAFARGYDVRKKELVIVFNDQNIVARHSMIDSTDSVKTGFLDGGPASSLAAGGSVSSSTGVSSSTASPPPVATPASSAAPRMATQSASAAPQPDAPAPGPYDGAYSGGVDLGLGNLRQLRVSVVGGKGRGTARLQICPQAGRVTLTIDPSGAVSGEADLLSGGACEPRKVAIEGRVDNKRLQLTMASDGSATAREFFLTRQNRGTGIDD